MGYYVQITETDVVLNQEYFDDILHMWKDLNHPRFNHLKPGGSFDSEGQNAWWYSWMPEDYDKTVKSVAEMLDLLRFDYYENADGNLVISSYDCKIGSESIFFNAIAQYIPRGQKICWLGEDDTQFVWYFTGEKLHEIEYDSTEDLNQIISNIESTLPPVDVEEDIESLTATKKLNNLLPKTKLTI